MKYTITDAVLGIQLGMLAGKLLSYSQGVSLISVPHRSVSPKPSENCIATLIPTKTTPAGINVMRSSMMIRVIRILFTGFFISNRWISADLFEEVCYTEYMCEAYRVRTISEGFRYSKTHLALFVWNLNGELYHLLVFISGHDF